MTVAYGIRVRMAPDVMVRMVGDEAVLLNLTTELYLGLNAVGTRMWTVLTEAPSVQAAYDSFLTEFDVEADQLRQDLDAFLIQLRDQQLIEVGPVEVISGNPSG